MEEVRDLEEAVESAEETLDTVSAPRNVFKLGVIRGVGSAFGATVVFAVLASLIAWLIGIADLSWVERILEQLGLSVFIEE